MPLVTSAIINVDQDVDEEWPLEVYGHKNGGKAVNVTMQPGDMVLYESHSVIHGRPFPFIGNFFANLFVHFEVIGPLDPTKAEPVEDPDNDIPPYIIPGSPWEREWKSQNPNGWKSKYNDPAIAAKTGDHRTLQRLAISNPTKLFVQDDADWQPLHEAIRAGDLQSVKILINAGADVLAKTKHGNALDIAETYLGPRHRVRLYISDLTKKALEDGPDEEL
jgi:prolyl 4-hydroxylase